jgi:hypothetical protein
MYEAILWRRTDVPGHEACRLSAAPPGWRLEGSAVFLHERQPCRLDYAVLCDGDWNTLSGWVSGWVGQTAVAVEVAVEAGRRWRLNGVEVPAVAGCADIDLNFSPATNLLPIRRLSLAPGASAEVRAAWLRFPSFRLEPLDQVYRRLDAGAYRYESGGGTFTADIRVNPAGFVLSYAIWQAETE